MTTTITVSTQAELIAALKQASGGETILLAAGDYGSLKASNSSSFGLTFTSAVTIAALDPATPPVFSGLDVRNATNITFCGITFDYTYASGDPLSAVPFSVTGGSGIAFEDCVFDGDNASGLSSVDDGYGSGYGLRLNEVTNARVENCEISGFWRGIVVGYSDGVVIRGNDLHGMRSDGMDFTAVQGVLIEENHIHDFRRSFESGDHADMIQFWTGGTTRPTTDVIIRNNLLDIGSGDRTQSIFMRNELVDQGLAGAEMFYQNVLIEGNIIVNGHANGIYIGETAGLTIRSNSVLHDDGALVDGADASVEIPRIALASASTGVIVTHNATAMITGYSGQAGWVVTQNAIVQDQNAFGAGYYGDVFETGSLTPTSEGAHLFLAKVGGLLDQLDAGAPVTLGLTAPPWGSETGGGSTGGETPPPPPPPASSIDANITIAAGGSDVQARIFDASTTVGDQPAGTKYLWTFGDGTTAEGKTVTHAYAEGGNYDVTLKVTTPTGLTNTETARVTVTGDELIRLDDSGHFAVSPDGIDIGLTPKAAAMTAEGLQLGSGISANIGRSHLAPLFSTDDVTMRMVLEADRAGTTGEVARLQGAFVVSVNSKGELQLRAWSSDGTSATLVSTGTQVNRGDEHEIEVRLDGGKLSLWVDGVQEAETAFSGTFANSSSQDLIFGTGNKTRGFNGDLAGFEIDLDSGGYHPGFDAAMTDRFATLTSNDPLF